MCKICEKNEIYYEKRDSWVIFDRDLVVTDSCSGNTCETKINYCPWCGIELIEKSCIDQKD